MAGLAADLVPVERQQRTNGYEPIHNAGAKVRHPV
jgi:hypothetical protein